MIHSGAYLSGAFIDGQLADQKVWGSNPYGRTILLSERKLLASFSDHQSHSGNLENLA
jgi:hypothetical protein